MKCTPHNAEAVAVCVWCGKALCPACAKPTASQRMVCSDNCAAALDRQSKAMDTALKSSAQSTRANAFYFFLCGALTAAGGVAAKFYLPSPFLIWFCFGAAAVFTASGLWYLSIARKS
ncbi:MAG TPA: hypothetical protein VMH87_17080 [Pseudomonadales bacterium]|nr:hypothetical protein [Pseudomonadales bacterium]